MNAPINAPLIGAGAARHPGYIGRTTPKRRGDYGTLSIVLEVLREHGPLTCGQIAELAGDKLPTRATGKEGRRNVVSRDLCRELARGDASRVSRIASGHRFTTWAVRS